MAYIGNPPISGNFQVCDAISVVNGQAAYTMQVSSANVSPESANHMLVSLNGVLQKPGSSFTISGSTITFASNLATGDVIDFILLLGNVNDIGTPSDATVTDAKTNFVSTSSAAGLQIKGDGTTDGTLQLNCRVNSHGIKLASPPHSAGQSYTLTFPTGNVTADKFLKVASVSGSGATGVGQLSFADAGGGEKTLLATTTVSSGVSEVVFNNTYFTSTYRDYVLSASQLDVDTDSARVYMQISSDNASSYKTGSNYKYGVYGFENTGGNIGQSGTSAYFEITSTPTSDADARTTSFKMHIINPLSTSTYFSWYNLGFSHTTADRSNTFHGAGYFNDSAGDAFNAIRIYASSGNIDQGVFKLYGIN